MGLFGRKKHNDSQVSVLSETEIQQKLYGEFKQETSQVAGAGERERSLDSSSISSKKTGAGVSSGLFSSSKEAEKKSHPGFFSPSGETSKSPEPMPKPAAPEPGERRYQAASIEQADDAYARYREHYKSSVKGVASFSKIRNFRGKAAAFFNAVFGPGKLITRQALYWTAGVLVVFLLFWGVNALNTQRERFMQTKYQQAPAGSPAKSVTLTGDRGSERAASAVLQSSESVPEGISVPISRTRTAPATVGETSEPSKTVSADVKYGGRFVIQVATYPSEDYAGRVMASMKQAGFNNAFVRENVRSSGAIFYVVMIGGFRTASEAQQQLAKFRATEVSRPFSDAFVKTIA